MTEKPIDPDGERFVPPETELDDTDLPPAAEEEVLDEVLGDDAPTGPLEDPEDGPSLVDSDPALLAGDPDDSGPDPGEDT